MLTADEVPDGVQRLWELWRDVTGRKREPFKDEHRRWLEQGISDCGMSDAEAAIRGIAMDDFAMGRAEISAYRGRPKVFNAPRHIFWKSERTDEFIALGRTKAPGGAMVAPDETRGKSWEQITNELLERFANARNDLMEAAHNAWVAGTLLPIPAAELAAFSPKLLPVGKLAFRGYLATVFPDGPTGNLYLVFIHTCNATAALIAADEMRNAYPVSLGMRLLTEQFVSASKKERLLQYARAVRDIPNVPTFRQRYVEIEQDVSPYDDVEVVS